MKPNTLRVLVRKFKSDMMYILTQTFRHFKAFRTRDCWKIVQAVTTVLILAYFISIFVRETRNQEKTVIDNAVKRELYLERNIQPASVLQTNAPTGKQRSGNKMVYQRLDAKPELTEKLPFLPNYKSPCWEEQDETIPNEIKLRCLPYFYVAGFSHCGTKQLFNQLTIHPLISGDMKPSNRWLTKLRFLGFPFLSDYLQNFDRAIESDIKRVTTNNSYHNAIFGDFTPSVIWDNHYLTGESKKKNMTELSYTTAHVIKDLNPNARIIALLCDPVERLYDDWLSSKDDLSSSKINVSRFHEHVKHTIDKFTTCLRNNTLTRCTFLAKPWGTTYKKMGLTRLEIGIYLVHLENFMKVFPKNQILVIKKEKDFKDTLTNLQAIFTFLGVGKITDPMLLKQMEWESMDDHDVKSKMLPETKKLLQDFYKPYNERLIKLLGEKFNFNST